MDAVPSSPRTWRGAVVGVAQDLSPGAFTFVMATGIVSTALAERGASASSAALLWIAAVGYVVLWVGYLWRTVFRWQRVRTDLAGPRGFAFLTLVAASDVLASRLALDGHYDAAMGLTVIGVAGWLGLGYGVPLLLVCSVRVLLLRQVNGTWFIWVVGTQSVAVAATALAPHAGGRALGVLASGCWAVGLLQYLLVAALALARLLLEPVEPKELVPPYWVFMGAAAISVLAGARLLRLPPADALLPGAFVLGVSAVVWSFCTWLIPLLLALGMWRHVLHRVPLRYESSLWSMVFPIGMYGVATRELGEAAGWGWMTATGAGEAWAALVVWAVVFAGMLAAPAIALRGPRQPGAK
ncbi:tellurite resistance/C4-dicarboxylate transporter family protein [Streptomyces sp. F-1]|uniref:tellurite resistance/C4-dicarboxylate transporter family protein n=1 Tax=Streptomyces sp. F-1 TaxID=463642 RepID=UPI000869BC07|nr:tellurite resistance/C4-dicarboxylate transporter family protein [Streptomyces sp. F-1]SFY53596.1 putative membrane protein [Streptomyces sp. F-1]